MQSDNSIINSARLIIDTLEMIKQSVQNGTDPRSENGPPQERKEGTYLSLFCERVQARVLPFPATI